jgi:hypothetical protein
MSMSARPFNGSSLSWLTAARAVRLAVVSLVIGAGPGCVRTTSLGRATAPLDAPVERRDATTDRQADGGRDDARPEVEPQVDAAADSGPIVGGGRDGPSEGDDSAPGAGDGPPPDAAAD